MKNYLILLEQAHISYSLATIYVGIKLKLLDKKNLEYYVDKILSDDESKNKPLITLIVEGYTEAALINCMYQLKIAVPIENDDAWQHEVRILRYAYLTDLMNHETNDEILLEKTASFYEDIQYPSDMDHLIYYMPSPNSYNISALSIEESRKNLVKKIQEFLNQEKDALLRK